MLITLENHRPASQELHEGKMPPAAYEYPEIKLSPRPANASYKDIFIASEDDIGTTDWLYLYIKNPSDTNKPTLVWLSGESKEYPRSAEDQTLFYVMLPGAVVVDVVTSPLYVVYALGLTLLLVLAGGV